MSEVFGNLLKSYRQIWKNRILPEGDASPEQILKEAIKRELEDANSHPRVRKSMNDKYFTATKRIADSSLSNDDKVGLIEIHIEVAEQLIKVRG
ncbi:hypothetical protein LCL96_05950 [Rossellomorea aquimaris]|uniref:hypothetical protein n=1 Tax=Rossellomorea TaxID=2837508 RepID=UPI001CD37B54|nr:hypothetical protein [Rossellomorea aquimaris]MCA1058467.1 hypothetical protein [Rossellomorea aquimaris]